MLVIGVCAGRDIIERCTLDNLHRPFYNSVSVTHGFVISD